MKAIILAGGEGKRLRPVTFEIPKPLITVRKKPLINYNLKLFADAGVSEVKILIRPSDREDYAQWKERCEKDFAPMKVDIIEEPEPMGTFGYIFHSLRPWMEEGEIFVTNGDDIKKIDLPRMLEEHRGSGAMVTVALMEMEHPDDYGLVEVEGNRALKFLEKQPNAPKGFVSAGMYVISPSALAWIAGKISPDKKMLMFERDLFPAIADEKALGAFFAPGRFYDCGTFERWEQAMREVED